MNYLNRAGALRPPTQRERATPEQVKNAAGGYVFPLSPWAHLQRFLILGTEAGTYYTSENDLTKQSVESVRACLVEDPLRVISMAVEISVTGRAPKNDQAILVLAMAAAHENEWARKVACSHVSTVCRTGTHLYQWIGFVRQLRGIGPTVRRAISDWYANQSAADLAYSAVKYRQRYGWTHRDLLRLAHPKGLNSDAERNAVVQFMLRGASPPADAVGESREQHQSVIEGFLLAQEARTPKDTARIVRAYNLPREAVKPEHLTTPEVWDALLDAPMPLTAMVRNLGNMSKVGLLGWGSSGTKRVVTALQNAGALRKARVHPMALLIASCVYGQGHGVRGHGEWQVEPEIVDALDGAFHSAFGNVEATGKRIMVNIDISGSMQNECSPGLTCMEAAQALALVTLRTEPDSAAFNFNNNLERSHLSGVSRLGEALQLTPSWRMHGGGATDCAQPMLKAMAEGYKVDTFVILTDNETWFGDVHPFHALQRYRAKMSIEARLIVVGMTGTRNSIADPSDAGMLDVVGFDTSVPEVIRQFTLGTV